MSRQNYYQRRRQRRIQQVHEDAVVSWVKRERQVQPKLGGLKLKVRMKGLPFELGRDRGSSLFLVDSSKTKMAMTAETSHSVLHFTTTR